MLDPFSINGIRDQLTLDAQEAITLVHAAEGDPEIAYAELSNRLRGAGVSTETQRLAVVIPKADLLRRTSIPLPSESKAIAGWLAGVGVHNLVMAAQQEFSEVRYFAVASQDVTIALPDDPGAPLRWLLASNGVRLPADSTVRPARTKSTARQTMGSLDHQ